MPRPRHDYIDGNSALDGVPDEKSTPSVPVQRSLLPFNAYLPDEPIEGLSGVVGVDGVAERVAEQPFALFLNISTNTPIHCDSVTLLRLSVA